MRLTSNSVEHVKETKVSVFLNHVKADVHPRRNRKESIED